MEKDPYKDSAKALRSNVPVSLPPTTGGNALALLIEYATCPGTPLSKFKVIYTRASDTIRLKGS